MYHCTMHIVVESQLQLYWSTSTIGLQVPGSTVQVLYSDYKLWSILQYNGTPVPGTMNQRYLPCNCRWLDKPNKCCVGINPNVITDRPSTGNDPSTN
jgi:hypothetical protein